MLVESKSVRRCLSSSLDNIPLHAEPRSYTKQHDTSLNPLPALIILLLGVMMSSHHQNSATSTVIHPQWGNLLVGFSLCRITTYILLYISPPTSIYASHPPTELTSAFCLISGGIILMASTKDLVSYLERKEIMAMFVFTVTMGATAMIMAREVIVLAFKGWMERKEAEVKAARNRRGSRRC